MPVVLKIKMNAQDDDWMTAARLKKIADGKAGPSAAAAKEELLRMENDPMIKPRKG